MGIRIVLFFIAIFLTSCSHQNLNSSCVVSKSALVMGRTDVRIEKKEIDLEEYCRSYPGCKKMFLKIKEDKIVLMSQLNKNSDEATSITLGQIIGNSFIGEKNLSSEYQRLKKFDVDFDAKIVKQILDTNILFYNKNEINFGFTNSCKVEEALLGAIAINFLENIPAH